MNVRLSAGFMLEFDTVDLLKDESAKVRCE